MKSCNSRKLFFILSIKWNLYRLLSKYLSLQFSLSKPEENALRFHEAVLAKYDAEVEVYRIAGKLELFEDLFNDGVMNHVKEKLETELALAYARLSDVKVPNFD
ncbi:unnamed protein product [Eruca vesicaria subsp. sativa]|uniref:Uncharacterized protein n=1 Tax=Eruca vesicaria subsp. sativa TaxID=29727 RepID=A0ABC8KHT1_ERUVS|nr:unnamed protein product [Eruca vesicaria subsp. sativa]